MEGGSRCKTRKTWNLCGMGEFSLWNRSNLHHEFVEFYVWNREGSKVDTAEAKTHWDAKHLSWNSCH